MKIYSCILHLCCFSSLVACSSSQYRFQSTPAAAEVELVMKNGSRKTIGKTPLSVNAAEVNPNKEAFQVEFKKDGYESYGLFVAESTFNKSIEVNSTLRPTAVSDKSNKSEVVLNEVAAMVADIQKDIQSKNFDMALNKLNKMTAEHPGLPTFYSLMGNVHYLERRVDKALVSYKRALELNPGSIELQKIVEKLSGLSGGSR